MDRRLKLQNALQNVMGIRRDGEPNVYFQPPESIKLNYPCIVYQLTNGDTKFANDMPYVFTKCYEVTLITRDPDCQFVKKLAMAFPMIVLNRSMVIDNLYHNVYLLYY